MTGPTVSLSGLAEGLAAAEQEVAEIATDAMRGATDTAKTLLRSQITDAGLGQRLANTWRGETYPNEGSSLNPAGYLYSKAPDIITSFATGASIAPHGGGKWLWIPSKNVPRTSGRANSKRMTPDQVLSQFSANEFIFRKGEGGRLLAFLAANRGLTQRGAVKRPRRGRLAHGERGELVLMFTLVASTADPQVLDLQSAADRGAADFVERFEAGTAT